MRVEASDEIMGSTFSVVLHGTERARLDAAANAALDEAHRLDSMLSNYKPDSEWSEMNRVAATRPVKVSDELFRLLSRCVEYSQQSDGAFDITVGPLMKVWGFYKGEGVMPRPASVEAARQRVGYRHVRLDAAARTVRFEVPGVELDPGGIGKGYAVDRMVTVLKEKGVDTALVSASGSSIYGMGAPPTDPDGWPITIRAPRDPDKVATTIRLKDMSVSTSGSYEKFFWADGRTYSHIVDPRTGYPAQGTASVSVVGPLATDTEVWTKPYFINGRAWTAAHKPPHLRVFLCEDSAQQTCAWVQQRSNSNRPHYATAPIVPSLVLNLEARPREETPMTSFSIPSLVLGALGGALAVLVLRSTVKVAANRLYAATAVAQYDCAEDGSEGRLATVWHAWGEPIRDPSASNGKAWLHTSQRRLEDRPHTVFGPYSNDLGRPGYIRVRFRIAGSAFQPTDDVVIVLDVTQAPYDLKDDPRIILVQRYVRARELNTEYRSFDIVCYTMGTGVYEYRARVIQDVVQANQRITFDVIRVYRYYPLWEIV